MSDRAEQTAPLIQCYRLELSEPPCIPGAHIRDAKAILEDSIAPVLPYLNAALRGADYHPDSGVVIWREGGRQHACRCRDIAVAPVAGKEEARRLIDGVVDIIDGIWQRRGEIMPSFKPRCLPSSMDIYRLLPRTNCRECGYPSCMAYAVQLREGEANVSQCPYLSDDSSVENRKKLLGLLQETGGDGIE